MRNVNGIINEPFLWIRPNQLKVLNQKTVHISATHVKNQSTGFWWVNWTQITESRYAHNTEAIIEDYQWAHNNLKEHNWGLFEENWGSTGTVKSAEVDLLTPYWCMMQLSDPLNRENLTCHLDCSTDPSKKELHSHMTRTRSDHWSKCM